MAITLQDMIDVGAGAERGRLILDEFNPTKLGVGSATPVTTQAALTAATGNTIDTTYGADEADQINNLVTRQGEIEAALEAFGIVASA